MGKEREGGERERETEVVCVCCECMCVYVMQRDITPTNVTNTIRSTMPNSTACVIVFVIVYVRVCMCA